MDELGSVAAVVEVDGEEWLMSFDAGSYGGKWYALNAGGNLGLLLGIPIVMGGVAPADSI